MKCKKGLNMKMWWDKDFWKNPELNDPLILEAVKNFKGDEEPIILHRSGTGYFFLSSQGNHTGKDKDNLLPIEVFVVTGLQGFYPYKES